MKEENKVHKELDGTRGYEEQTHPAFGMVGIGNVTGNKKLFGSSVNHGHFIHLEVMTGKRYIDAHTERFHGGDLICRVSLSHSQLAEMMFKANHGSGVPCTIEYVVHEGSKPPIPPEEDMGNLEESRQLLKERLQDLFNQFKELCKEVEEITARKAPLKKADRDRLKFLAFKINQDIESNLPYATECFDEKVEKTVSKAKAEFESFVDMSLRAKGLEAMKNKPVLELDNKTDE